MDCSFYGNIKTQKSHKSIEFGINFIDSIENTIDRVVEIDLLNPICNSENSYFINGSLKYDILMETLDNLNILNGNIQVVVKSPISSATYTIFYKDGLKTIKQNEKCKMC